MKPSDRRPLAVLLSTLVASAVFAAAPARPSKQYTIEQLLESTAISGASF